MKNVNIKTKIAVVISILCIVVSIANIFLNKEPLRIIIWTGVTVVFALDFIVMMENNTKLLKKLYAESLKARSYEKILSDVRDMLQEELPVKTIITKIDIELEEKEIKNAN